MDKNALIEKIETKILEFEEGREAIRCTPNDEYLGSILALAEHEAAGDIIMGLQLALDIVKDEN